MLDNLSIHQQIISALNTEKVILKGVLTNASVPAFHTNYTHHPDHEVGEDGDPESGQKEGDHEVSLPARLGTVWDGEKQH